MIRCGNCRFGVQKFCCEGCCIPSYFPLGSCLHYQDKGFKAVKIARTYEGIAKAMAEQWGGL